MQKDNYIILSGAMGAGKSTTLVMLREIGCICVDEPARQVLAEQRATNGNGLPEADANLFIELMLGKMISAYGKFSETTDIVFFDRGLPDLVGYAELLKVDNELFRKTAGEFRYNKHVFMFNGWRDIYIIDDERKMSFELANKFGINVSKIYEENGYMLHDVPKGAVEERIKFIFTVLDEIQ